MGQAPQASRRTIRRQQLREIVPLADSTVYDMEQRGEFPQRFYLTSRCVVWDLAEVEAWLDARRTASVRTYHDERKRLSAKANARRTQLELRLGELDREIDRLVDAIAKGHGDPAVLGPRSSVLDKERKQVARELDGEPAASDVISLHPAVLARYEQQLVHLQDALSKGVNAGDTEAAEASEISSRR
jgi:predicted DNA-binding transcriptional regulator AlpA